MKLLSTYKKEMKIASRGFYFYIEIFVAVLVLLILLVAVNDTPNSKTKEYVFYDMTQAQYDATLSAQLNSDEIIRVDDTELTLKAISFEVLNKNSDALISYDFDSREKITVPTLQVINVETGQILNTIYILNSQENLLRLSMDTSHPASIITMDGSGDIQTTYIIQGYEPDRYTNFLYLTNTLTLADIEDELDNQDVVELGSSERLSNKENIVPVYVVFAGSLMGFFIIISYLFLDKGEGVIKAIAVTPSSIWSYLLSKTFVILTTVVISSSIVVIPIMGLKPNYFLFYGFLIITTFAFSALGLLIGSFFKSISQSFGILYFIMIVLMIPAISYYASAFNPTWIQFFPTMPILIAFKGILLGQADWAYVGIYSGVFLIAGFGLLYLANIKFKKSLTL